MSNRKGFTLVELMVVILIVAILASVAVPIMRGRVDDAKWSEAAGTAGTIRVAVRTAFAEDPTLVTAGDSLGDATVRQALKFRDGDLDGTYFDAADYTISNVDENGNADITVTGDGIGDTPLGTGALNSSGWLVTESSGTGE